MERAESATSEPHPHRVDRSDGTVELTRELPQRSPVGVGAHDRQRSPHVGARRTHGQRGDLGEALFDAILNRTSGVPSSVDDYEVNGQRVRTPGGLPNLYDQRRVGAEFRGRNQHPALGEWTIPCFVDAYDEPRAFGWHTSDPNNPGARWRFDLERAAGRTRLRFSYTMGPGPSGTTMAITNHPGKEARVLRRRLDEVHANMQRTVEGIKQLAEERR